ncbi:MAG TPA: PfkB family carbohydrate kinase [Candidatus Binatia bacterium]|nr:PfkB family carbohydrate kinase [Candidatus Binatia bacterium]
MRTAVLGHVEWVDFVRVERIPRPGEIIRAVDAWEEPAGGGGVSAVQLAKLAGSCTLYTALGDDERGRRARQELSRLGVRVEAAVRREPQRRAVTFVDATGERTITVIGNRIAAAASDPLPWGDLAETDAVYLCAADAEAIRLARRARVLVATARVLPVLREAGVALDALVGSLRDPSERYRDGDLHPPPKGVVVTDGENGGEIWERGLPPRRFPPARLPGPLVDTYGAGDSFAAGLAYGLASGVSLEEAVATAARCGAAALTGRGAFAGQLRIAPG